MGTARVYVSTSEQGVFFLYILANILFSGLFDGRYSKGVGL